jgi:transposase
MASADLVCSVGSQPCHPDNRLKYHPHIKHRGRKHDFLYRARRLLTMADERLDDHGREKLMGLLNAGDPEGHVFATWQAKELVRGLYDHHDPALALEFVRRLGNDLQDPGLPEEARSLGRTLLRWKHQIAAWHEAHVSNGPTEAANNLIKRVKRVAFGFRTFRNYRIRTLLRRQAKLVTARHDHTPLDSNAPLILQF